MKPREKSTWNFPAAHYLESWGDAITSDGTLVPIQPLIQPLFGGITELEFLARLAGEAQTNPYEIVRATLALAEEDWKGFCSTVSRRIRRPQPVEVKLNSSFPGGSNGGDALPKTSLEVIFFRDAKVDDGRYANNGWMQELPDPITKMTWDNAVLDQPQDGARTRRGRMVICGNPVEHGVTFSESAGRQSKARSGFSPAWRIIPSASRWVTAAKKPAAWAPASVSMPINFSARKLAEYVVAGATIKKTGETHILACTQHHWSMEGRPAVREFNLDEVTKN